MKLPELPLWWGRRWDKCPQDGAVPLHWGGKAAALPLPGLLPCMLRISTSMTGITHLSFKLHKGQPLTEEFAMDFWIFTKTNGQLEERKKNWSRTRAHPSKSGQARTSWTSLMYLCFLRNFLNHGKIGWERRACVSITFSSLRWKLYLAMCSAKGVRVLLASRCWFWAVSRGMSFLKSTNITSYTCCRAGPAACLHSSPLLFKASQTPSGQL